ncbi:MAG: ABC transporter ATP-binding protein [Desulfobacteraceae bacterium]|jgi:putative ABC transport system ATP-binding protein
MALIQITDLGKVYNSKTIPVEAVRHLDLTIDKGEFTAIVGPSGSGKTTLLNLIGGLDSPSYGRIIIDGTNIADLKQSEMVEYRLHHIGFVFQAYNLIPVLSARENVEFIMLLQGMRKKERHNRAKELLDAVGLGERMESRPSQLSGGQQQRVAVARALASHPAFVLADEPTANLDSESTASLLDLMDELNKKFEMTFVFSTHDARVIQRARRVVTLEDGMIKPDGATS